MTLGQELDLDYGLRIPGHNLGGARSIVQAGSYVALAMFGGSVSSQRLTALQSQIATTKTILESGDVTQISTLNREGLLGDMFYAGVLGYYSQLTAMSNATGLRQQATQNILLTGGTYGYVPKVDYFFGFPRSIQAGGVAMDLNREIDVTHAWNGNKLKRFNMTQQTGMIGSALEHAVPEQMFISASNPGEAVSAVKLLSKATQAGQRIYHITQANQAKILPNLHLDATVMKDIQAGLNAGKEVITHTDNLTVNGYTGAGYIIYDPVNGDGAYLIEGGMNGGLLILMIFLVVGLIALAFGIGLLFVGSVIGTLIGMTLIASSALLLWGLGQELGYSIVLAGIGLITVFLAPAAALGLGVIVSASLIVEATLALVTWILNIIYTTYTFGKE